MKPLFARIFASPWFTRALRWAGSALALLGLAALGSGALDRWLAARPAFASSGPRSSPSVVPSPAIASASGAPSASGGAPTASSSAGTAQGQSSTRTPEGKLVLNLATARDLDALPGVGPRKAEAIVALRDKLGGRFRRLEDLMRIRGIKRKFLERLRPLVVLDP